MLSKAQEATFTIRNVWAARTLLAATLRNSVDVVATRATLVHGESKRVESKAGIWRETTTSSSSVVGRFNSAREVTWRVVIPPTRPGHSYPIQARFVCEVQEPLETCNIAKRVFEVSNKGVLYRRCLLLHQQQEYCKW